MSFQLIQVHFAFNNITYGQYSSIPVSQVSTHVEQSRIWPANTSVNRVLQKVSELREEMQSDFQEDIEVNSGDISSSTAIAAVPSGVTEVLDE
jgi:hypothetical protein